MSLIHHPQESIVIAELSNKTQFKRTVTLEIDAGHSDNAVGVRTLIVATVLHRADLPQPVVVLQTLAGDVGSSWLYLSADHIATLQALIDEAKATVG